MIILHIAKKDHWLNQQNQPFYRDPSLDTLGFLHCAQIKDVVDAANCFYRGQPDRVLLCIDTAKVTPEIKWETSEYGVQYPHVCGALNRDAIVEVLDFPINAEGWFILPDSFKDGQFGFFTCP